MGIPRPAPGSTDTIRKVFRCAGRVAIRTATVARPVAHTDRSAQSQSLLIGGSRTEDLAAVFRITHRVMVAFIDILRFVAEDRWSPSTFSFSERTAGMDELIHLEHLTKDYGRLRALDDVSLRLGPGIIGLLGPNGAGKSTLIKGPYGSGASHPRDGKRPRLSVGERHTPDPRPRWLHAGRRLLFVGLGRGRGGPLHGPALRAAVGRGPPPGPRDP